MTDDIVARAKAALEGIDTPMPWRFSPWERGVGSSELRGACGVHMAWAIDDGDGTFIAQSPELVAKLAAEVERLRDVKAEWRMYCIRAESERDQLKAAVERVRAEAEAYACQPGVLEPCGAVAQGILAALDGDDQSGDPCCGNPAPRVFRDVAGEHTKSLSCGTLLGGPQSGDPS